MKAPLSFYYVKSVALKEPELFNRLHKQKPLYKQIDYDLKEYKK